MSEAGTANCPMMVMKSKGCEKPKPAKASMPRKNLDDVGVAKQLRACVSRWSSRIGKVQKAHKPIMAPVKVAYPRRQGMTMFFVLVTTSRVDQSVSGHIAACIGVLTVSSQDHHGHESGIKGQGTDAGLKDVVLVDSLGMSWIDS